MINLNDKQERLALIERYLDADTTVQEERMLAEYYTSNQPDADEVQISALIKLTHPNASDKIDTAEFDRITVRRKTVHMILKWSSVAAAAIILLLVCLRIGKPALPEEIASTMSTSQILEGMEMLSKIQVGEIGSIVAEPKGKEVIITIKLTDGKERSYSMTCNSDASSISFTALNNF